MRPRTPYRMIKPYVQCALKAVQTGVSGYQIKSLKSCKKCEYHEGVVSIDGVDAVHCTLYKLGVKDDTTADLSSESP